MNSELVWLAYDKLEVDRAWNEIPIAQLYFNILNDDFRRKVDPRTMLFHRGQYYLLKSIETLMHFGAMNITITEYMASLFKKEIEVLPIESSEYFFDFQLISFYTSLKMSDDYSFATKVFSKLFKNQKWNITLIKDESEFFSFFTKLNSREVLNLIKSMDESTRFKEEAIILVQNYVEFYQYAKNNNLDIFYYNNLADIKYWGNLIERKNERAKTIIDILYKDSIQTKKVDINITPKKITLKKNHSFEPIIAALLNDPDIIIKQKAAETLGLLGDKNVIPHLVEALRDNDLEVKQEILRALGEIRDKNASNYLIAALDSEEVQIVQQAAFSLFLLNEKRGIYPILKSLLRGVISLSSILLFYPEITKNEKITNMLIKNLDHSNILVRREIAFLLGSFVNNYVVRALKKLEREEDDELKIFAASSLLRVGTRDALKGAKEFFAESSVKFLFIDNKTKEKLNAI
jgi:hypothetical protein